MIIYDYIWLYVYMVSLTRWISGGQNHFLMNCEGFRTNFNIPSPLPTTFVFREVCRLLNINVPLKPWNPLDININVPLKPLNLIKTIKTMKSFGSYHLPGAVNFPSRCPARPQRRGTRAARSVSHRRCRPVAGWADGRAAARGQWPDTPGGPGAPGAWEDGKMMGTW